MKFAEERTEHYFTLSGTDIDVMRPENFLMEFVLMEKSEGWKNIIILDLFISFAAVNVNAFHW